MKRHTSLQGHDVDGHPIPAQGDAVLLIDAGKKGHLLIHDPLQAEQQASPVQVIEFELTITAQDQGLEPRHHAHL